uniref:26S proteasome non-ATPase regulatory subunit 5 n=1 Tax=Aegilops tauschii subsp. strangulata TaxID=200361 RepID=A0A452ZV21_AEGTS
MDPAAEMDTGELDALLRAAADFASYPGTHGEDTVRQFLEQFPLPKLLGVLQSQADLPETVETVAACLDKVFSSRYGASLLPSYGEFIQAGLLTNSNSIKQLACKAVVHLLDKAGDIAVAVDTFVQHNLYPLLINCLVEGDEEISAIVLDAIKRLAEIPTGTDIIFPPDGQGLQLNKVAAQSSSMARIRILSLIAKLFGASSCTATAIRDSNLLSLFEDEIKDRKDMLKTLSALEVLYELAEHPHSNMFLLKTSLLQHITDVINDPSADSIVRSRASLISGRLLSSADAFMTIEKSCVTNLLLAIDKILRTEESQNTDEIESALETLGLIGTTTQGACLLLSDPPNIARHVVEMSFDRQGRGKHLAALHALGSICGVDRQEDQMKLDDPQAEEFLKRLVYSAASNSPKLTPSALLLSILQQDPDVRIAGYRVLSGLVVREWCLREVCSKPEIIGIVTDPKMETTKLGMEARYACCVAINKALSSSHLLHEPSLSELIGKVCPRFLHPLVLVV